jgi:hypothetical protein
MWANIGSVCWRERRGRRTVAVTCNMRQYQLMRTTADIVACGAGVARDSLFLDVAWTYPAQNCSGTLRLHGATANRNTAIIGELSYADGCTGGQTKPGTFAMWKGARSETTIGH